MRTIFYAQEREYLDRWNITAPRNRANTTYSVFRNARLEVMQVWWESMSDEDHNMWTAFIKKCMRTNMEQMSDMPNSVLAFSGAFAPHEFLFGGQWAEYRADVWVSFTSWLQYSKNVI